MTNATKQAPDETVPTVAQQFESLDARIVQVAVIRESVRELQERLESQIPGGCARLHTQPAEDRKPWVGPLNHLNSLDGDLLELISYLCDQRYSIHAEIGALKGGEG